MFQSDRILVKVTKWSSMELMIVKVTKWSSREWWSWRSQSGHPGNWWSWWACCNTHGSGRLLGDRNTNGAGDVTSPEGPGLAPSPGLSRASGVTSKMGTTSKNQMKINLLFQIHIHWSIHPDSDVGWEAKEGIDDEYWAGPFTTMELSECFLVVLKKWENHGAVAIGFVK